jgi:hypothetical protein
MNEERAAVDYLENRLGRLASIESFMAWIHFPSRRREKAHCEDKAIFSRQNVEKSSVRIQPEVPTTSEGLTPE